MPFVEVLPVLEFWIELKDRVTVIHVEGEKFSSSNIPFKDDADVFFPTVTADPTYIPSAVLEKVDDVPRSIRNQTMPMILVFNTSQQPNNPARE